jgi:hypothetical protein
MFIASQGHPASIIPIQQDMGQNLVPNCCDAQLDVSSNHNQMVVVPYKQSRFKSHRNRYLTNKSDKQ